MVWKQTIFFPGDIELKTPSILCPRKAVQFAGNWFFFRALYGFPQALAIWRITLLLKPLSEQSWQLIFKQLDQCVENYWMHQI